MQFIENEYVNLWIEDGIIFETLKPSARKLTLAKAKKIVEDRLKLSNKVTMPILVELNKTYPADKETKEYLAGEESLSYLSAIAFVIHDPATLIVAKLFLKFDIPKVKTEVFYDTTQAIKWLQKYKNPIHQERQ